MRTGFTPEKMALLDCEVVVVCSSFNQEEVLSNALDGFVMQKTSFPFVVLVHDDASTDSTVQVIKSYMKSHPELIKGVFDSENQYKKGNLFWYLDYLRAAKAPFLALCEGDDYWTDANKLEMQYRALKNNPDCSFSFTNAEKVDGNSNDNLGAMLPVYPWETQILKGRKLSTQDLLRITFIPTASMFARRDAWLKEPVLPNTAFRGDRAHQLFLSLNGSALYLDAITCSYRVNNSQSLMGGWEKSDSKMIKVLNSYIELYNNFDSYSDFNFHTEIQAAIDLKLFDIMLLTGNKGLVSKEIAWQVAGNRGLAGVFKYLLFRVSPRFYQFTRKIGRTFRPRSR